MSVLSHPAKTLLDRIANLTAEPSFSNFLGSLEFAANNPVNVKPLSEWWQAHAEDINSENPIAEFAQFFKKIEILSANREAERYVGGQPRNDAEARKARMVSSMSKHPPHLVETAFDLAEEAAALDKMTEVTAQGEMSKYWWFHLAWDFHTVLPQIFPDHDPGAVVGSYLRDLFPESDSSYWRRATISIHADSEPHKLLKSVCGWVVSHGNSKLDSLFDFLLNPQSPSRWSSDDEHFDCVSCDCHAIFELVCLLRGLPLSCLPSISKLPFSVAAKPDGPPHITVPILKALAVSWYGLSDALYELRIGEHWPNFFKAYKKLRKDELGGKSPLSIKDAWYLKFVVQETSHNEYALASNADYIKDLVVDPTILLAELHVVDEALTLRCSDGYIREIDWVLDDYLDLVLALRQEDLHELANAFLAFLIFALSVLHEGELTNAGPLLMDASESMRLPGGSMIRRAIEFASAFAGKKRSALEARKLASFLNVPAVSDDYRLDPQIAEHISAVKEPSKSNVENNLRQQLTEERWLKLDQSSRESLVRAEIQRQRCLSYDIDWGTVAVAYFKAIEHELNLRFSSIYCELNKRDANQHVNIGGVLLMLKKWHEQPEPFRSRIQSMSQLHRNKPLIKQLIDTLQKYRNTGAHPNSFPEDILHDLYKLLFVKGLLAELIDALPPVARF